MRTDGDPRPENWDALTQAYIDQDAVAIAREQAAYNAQLIKAGRRPLYRQPEDDGRHP